MSEGREKLITGLAVILCMALVYVPLLKGTFLYNKDNYLVENIRQVSSLEDYYAGFKEGRILDLQPVRDLSYKASEYLLSFAGEKRHLLTNLLIWFLICMIAFTLIRKLNPGLPYPIFAILLFCTHPLFVQSVAWISARKHLLSFLFILLATRLTLLRGVEKRKTRVQVSILFLLSVLSQPITIFWPAWVFVFMHVERRMHPLKNLRSIAPLLAISAVVGVLNLSYYGGLYERILGVSKYSVENSFADRILALGRYFIQLAYPFSYSSFYFNGSALNLIGVPALVLAVYFSWKIFGKKGTVIYFSLFFLSLLPVIMNLTEVFISDTYLLLGGLALFLLITGKEWRPAPWAPWALSVLLALFLYRGHVEASYFLDHSRYLKNSYDKEPACSNLYNLVEEFFRIGDVEQGGLLGDVMVRRNCIWTNKTRGDEHVVLYSKVLAYSPTGPRDERERALLKLTERALYFKLAYGVFNLRNGNVPKALHSLDEVLQQHASISLRKGDVLVMSYLNFCQGREVESCRNLLRLVK